MRNYARITILVMLFGAFTASAFGTVPSSMTVQGRLTKADGTPVAEGDKKFLFKIFTAETGGEEVWPRNPDQEAQGIYTDAEGLWTAHVGAVIPLDSRIFDYSPLWLAVQVDVGDGFHPLPRMMLHVAPFAQRAAVSERADANSVTSGAIVDGTVRSSDLASDAVTSGHILNGTLLAEDIALGTITPDRIAPNSLAGDRIADGAIGTLELATGAVNNIDLATNAVTSDKIVNGAVGTADIADNAITTAKILNLSILNEDLSNSCINSAKIFDGSIVNADISTSADISPSKVAGTAATLTTSQTFNAAKNFMYNTGMGTTMPGTHKLMVESSLNSPAGATVFVKNTGSDGLGMMVEATSTDLPLLISQKGTGDVFRCDSYTGGWHPVFKVKNDGYTVASVLELTGGSDLAEPFGITGDQPIEPGMVVVIDADHPGQLRIAEHAYDPTVAGIISGANGLNPGLTMKQIGTPADGAHPVALSGRVYCWVDAGYGAVVPGDFLTTSDTPGHAMKVTDRDTAYGAVIGKAMTSLDSGRGLVLVLVNLQ